MTKTVHPATKRRWWWPFARRPLGVPQQLGLHRPHDMCSHVFLMGGSGSGKSSVIRLLMRDVFRGFENVSCCWFGVKADEPALALEVIGNSPLRDRLRHLVPGRFTFNVASYELHRDGGTPASLTRLLERLSEMLTRSKGGGDDQAFWAGLFRSGLEHAITLAHLAHGRKVTLQHVHDTLAGCPVTVEQARSEAFRTGPFHQLLERAEAGAKTDEAKRAYQQAGAFFLKQVTTIGDKARGAMLTQCTNVLAPLLRSPFRKTLCAETSNFTPETVLDDGALAVIDFPVLTWGDPALLLQNLISMLLLEAALRRPNRERVTLLVKDELQMLCADPEFECMAMSVARSHGIATVAATQNLPLLRVAMGGGPQGEQYALGLLGNFNTKLVLANQCNETNDYFSRAWGQHREQFVTISEQRPPEEHFVDLQSLFFGPSRFLYSAAEQMAPRCPPEWFLQLRRGGPANGFAIDAFLTQGGRTFGPEHSPFQVVSFRQR